MKRLNYNQIEKINLNELTENDFIVAFRKSIVVCYIELKDNQWQGFSNELRQFSNYSCFEELVAAMNLKNTDMIVYKKP